jgi:hypothetical protein
VESSNATEVGAMFSVWVSGLAHAVMIWFPQDVFTGISVSEAGSWTVVKVPSCPAAIATLILYDRVPRE